MRLTLIFLLATSLVFGGLPWLYVGEDGVRIAAYAENGVLTAVEDALENCDDNRIAASFMAGFQPGAYHPCLIALTSIPRSSEKQNPSQEDQKIYKLKRTFLI